MKTRRIFKSAFRVFTAPFRMVIAFANFLRAVFVIIFFAALVLLLAYMFSGKARSFMNKLILERKDKILERRTAEQIKEGRNQTKNDWRDTMDYERMMRTVTFKDYLISLTLLPISDMLNITKTEIITMPQWMRYELAERLDSYHIPMLLNDINDEKRFPGKDSLAFGWIPAKHLP